MTTQLISRSGLSVTVTTCDYTGISTVNGREFKTAKGAINHARKLLRNGINVS